jgi:SAM-dependent methyltransferase
VLGDDIIELLGERIPTDHARQVAAEHYVGVFYRDGRRGARVLDLGCGAGDSVDVFRRHDPEVRWVGVDLEDSPEVARRTRTDADFRAFDGERIPCEDDWLDLVFCKQVLEHVRRPEPLLREVARVLAPEGCFAGSTSQLEPFHSLSLWNYTPYGLTSLLEEIGLEVVEVRPCIDGLTLVVQRGMGMPRLFDRWWHYESPLNRFANLFGRAARLDARQVNAIKLVLCGQFCFLARRPGREPGGM